MSEQEDQSLIIKISTKDIPPLSLINNNEEEEKEDKKYDICNLPLLVPSLEQFLNSSQHSILSSIKKKGMFPFSESELISTKGSLFTPLDPFTNNAWKEAVENDSKVLTEVTSLSNKRMLKFQVAKKPELPKETTHRDYLLREMKYMSEEIRQGRKQKMYLAKLLSRAVMKYHKEKRREEKRKIREKEQQLKDRARWIAKQVKYFWREIKEWVTYKEQNILDKEEQEAKKKQLDLMVKQSEKFSEDLAKKFGQKYATKEKKTEKTNRRSSERLRNASKEALSFQPTGITLSTTKISTKIPKYLKGKLREYQHIGLDWLVTMYEKNLNGILADEMGLGKTIMTISLLAHLIDKKIWGPHLIIVPTSVLLNWEMELKRWCPAFKILTYFGSPKQRAKKRAGWTKPDSFHICLTSYKMVLQDALIFRRMKWFYLILDEAHNIKNFRSKSWQTLLNFNTERRLLLTGTPLQNNLMELWALMHFLMPHIFASHKEFYDWFSNPVNSMIEGSSNYSEDLINRLHSILRPFMLRRLKKDVEKQLPPKYEHVIYCRLSKRQKYLYDEFISSGNVKESLSGDNYFKIANILMQLRKVCNHPDLFEPRPIVSPFDMQPLQYSVPSIVVGITNNSFWSVESTEIKKNYLTELKHIHTFKQLKAEYFPSTIKRERKLKNRTRVEHLTSPYICIPAWKLNNFGENISIKRRKLDSDDDLEGNFKTTINIIKKNAPSFIERIKIDRMKLAEKEKREVLSSFLNINKIRCIEKPVVIGLDSINLIKKEIGILYNRVDVMREDPSRYLEYTNALSEAVLSSYQRFNQLEHIIKNFICYIPKARTKSIKMYSHHTPPDYLNKVSSKEYQIEEHLKRKIDILHPSHVRTQLYFPDKRLIQYDCGKLQELDILLRKLKSEGHRALIFTQMTKMLDILESFINLHGYTYLRLDGSVKVENRLKMMEMFNNEPKIFLFILSTRSGGLGINLTGADTVIFYDSDWNPAMDAQAQDRCHRIGQTREVNIYRLISSRTIEENILKKAKQKIKLDQIIKEGNFTTAFFRDILEKDDVRKSDSNEDSQNKNDVEIDLEAALTAAEDADDVAALKALQKETIEANKEEADEYKVFQDDDLSLLEKNLKNVQKYAVKFIENKNREHIIEVKGNNEEQVIEMKEPEISDIIVVDDDIENISIDESDE